MYQLCNFSLPIFGEFLAFVGERESVRKIEKQWLYPIFYLQRPTCDSGFDEWLVCKTFRFSKSFAKHGLWREAFLHNKREWSSGLYIRNLHSELSQCCQGVVQSLTRFIARCSHYDATVIHLEKVITQRSSLAWRHMGVGKNQLFHGAAERVNEHYVDAAMIRVITTPWSAPYYLAVQFDVTLPDCRRPTGCSVCTVSLHLDRAVCCNVRTLTHNVNSSFIIVLYSARRQ